MNHRQLPKSGVQHLLADLKLKHGKRITGHLSLPERAGVYEPFPEDMHPGLCAALRTRGVERLYSHQACMREQVLQGHDSVVVTPTASGKTLCYNLPVIEQALLQQKKALYLFPTKALAQDQVAELLELNRAAGLGLKAHTFDGDTPGDARKAVRLNADIVVSNPDMLHQGILPHHTKWAQFFENLGTIVIDEMHIYRGVFGSHVANVIRRLNRICAFYGSQPVFVLCSATIANPQELASQLVGRNVRAVTESGAPQGAKDILLWNPPVINPDLGIRASARSQITRIAKQAVRSGLQTLVFAQSRLMVEVITKYLKDKFDADPRMPSRVKAYRGGYLPTQRRETEREMRAGNVDCLVATSALELGVDIGSLDVCLLNGYPGTIASAWQRLGRAGRRKQASLGVLVASSQPLDQYIVRNPDFFLGASPEHGRIAPNQMLILLDHIRCAAFELPFSDGELFGDQSIEEYLQYLQEEGVLHREQSRWHWIDQSYPANNVSLRSVAEGNFVVINQSRGEQKIIAEVDYSSASLTLYEGAIYMIQAQPYQVERLDWVGRKAFVTETRADYYTDAIDYTRLKILDRFDQRKHAQASCSMGEVHVVKRVAGYKKIRYYSHENVGYGKVNLPDQELHTTAVWWQLDSEVLMQCFSSRWDALDGFLGAAYALHCVAAVNTMSEKQDLGRAVGNGDAKWFAHSGSNSRGMIRNHKGESIQELDNIQRFEPTLFLYDNYPGGIGLTEPLFNMQQLLVRKAFELIQSCDCAEGCPSCIGPILQAEERKPKASALTILNLFDAGASDIVADTGGCDGAILSVAQGLPS